MASSRFGICKNLTKRLTKSLKTEAMSRILDREKRNRTKKFIRD
jgi:hypothetical protein